MDLSGDPRNSSTGCDRSSSAFTPRRTERSMISPAFIVRPPKLYGTLRPTCTPAHLELGLLCDKAMRLNPIGVNRPSVEITSLPASRRLYSMGVPPAIRIARHAQ